MIWRHEFSDFDGFIVSDSGITNCDDAALELIGVCVNSFFLRWLSPLMVAEVFNIKHSQHSVVVPVLAYCHKRLLMVSPSTNPILQSVLLNSEYAIRMNNLNAVSRDSGSTITQRKC